MLIILTGLPSTGKSTFSKKLSKKLWGRGLNNIILGTDLIREQFPQWSNEQEEFIKNSTYDLIKRALKNYAVIVDDTNYYNSKRRDLINIAKENKKNHIIIYLKAPLNTILKRNIQRGAKIPNEVITNMFNKFDEPGTKYSWDKPDITIDTTKEINYNNMIEKILEINNKPFKKEKKEITEKENAIYNIDKITRKIMGEYIQTHKLDKDSIGKISELRKNFIKSVKNNPKNLKEIEKEFKEILNNYETL